MKKVTLDTIRIETFDSALLLGSQYEYTNNLPKPEDVYIICYTSGTTGTPKGVMLTHSNVVANISGFLKILFAFQPSMIDTTQVHISYLPLSHMMEQLTHWTLLGFGSKIGYFRGSIQGLTDDIKTLKPTVFPVVPRLLNRLYDAITSKVQQQGFMAKLVYNFAFARKLSQVRAGKQGRTSIWDRLVFRKIQEQIGGKVDLMVTGSAPISSTVLETCRVTLGATIVEGYGQTECTALATFTWMGDPSTGHCGAPAPCALVKLGDVPDLNYYAKDGKGEIRIKGPCVTKGYYKDPERTAELFDEEGFLQTGDIGEMLPNGTIRIIDRKKHIFKLAQGEYVAPEKIEQVYIRTPVAQQVYVDGDSLERWLIAVVVPEPDVLMEWNEKQGGGKRTLEEICEDEKAKEFVLSELHAIGKANKLNSIEQLILSIGSKQSSEVWQLVVGDDFRRKKFVESLIKMIDSTTADGIEISWTLDPMTSDIDKKNLKSLIDDISTADVEKKIDIFVAATSWSSFSDFYDYEHLNQTASLIVLHSHRLHSDFPATPENPPPLRDPSSMEFQKLRWETLFNHWVNKGVARSKIVLSLTVSPLVCHPFLK
uniref:long-chain-fatty-acid--CoA ligase n=1 Tax=Caenorhabditis tropicalis TaxID=1561998 RepID=A0A1I7UR56_9PELO